MAWPTRCPGKLSGDPSPNSSCGPGVHQHLVYLGFTPNNQHRATEQIRARTKTPVNWRLHPRQIRPVAWVCVCVFGFLRVFLSGLKAPSKKQVREIAPSTAAIEGHKRELCRDPGFPPLCGLNYFLPALRPRAFRAFGCDEVELLPFIALFLLVALGVFAVSNLRGRTCSPSSRPLGSSSLPPY